MQESSEWMLTTKQLKQQHAQRPGVNLSCTNTLTHHVQKSKWALLQAGRSERLLNEAKEGMRGEAEAYEHALSGR